MVPRWNFLLRHGLILQDGHKDGQKETHIMWA